MGVCSGKVADFDAQCSRYVPACAGLTEEFFADSSPDKNASASFFSSMRLAVRGLLLCDEYQANRFLVQACSKNPTTSSALDAFLSKTNATRVLPDANRAKVMQTWMTYDEDVSGDLSYKEIKKMVAGLNFPVELASEILESVRSSGATIRYPEFERAYRSATSFKELSYVFEYLTKGLGTMSRAIFTEFVRGTQGEEIDDEGITEMLNAVGCVDADEITRDIFLDYLSSFQYSIHLDRQKMRQVYQDMSLPIKDYFINSSHNTYLTGDQLTSKSSPDMYKKALLGGCRCVELDCWDGPRGEPIVYHGYTRTSKILFADCISKIHEYAFVTSQYPVILSLEVHTSPAQQDRMAEIMEKVFGDALFKPCWSVGEPPSFTFSPSALMGKILVKSKRGNYPIEGSCVDKYEDEGDDDDGIGAAVANDELTRVKAERQKKNNAAEKQSVSENLSAVVSIESAGYKGVDDLHYLQERHPYHCSSYSEGKAKKIYEQNQQAFIAINNAYLSRIYPAGSRFDSSNYNPQPYWNCGCQVVALNWQSTRTFEWRLNRGFFLDNGGTGYVLKPEYLRAVASKDVTERRTLTVEVISAFCLPKPRKGDKCNIADPLVSVFVEGPGMEAKPRRTKAIDNNGFHPVWRGLGDNEFTWEIVRWSMSSLIIQVFERDKVNSDGLISEAIVPLRILKRGYRRVVLTDVAGNAVPGACLMCNFTFL